jgi:class 3 adenylate cyclase
MGTPCPDCGHRNAREAAVCGGCGKPLGSAVALAAERRQLTVYFSDIVESTTLSEKLDPEDLRELYARYQSICAEVLQKYEGHIAQYLGDGVLAYFGYPSAHEDDAARAVRSALEILARVSGAGPGAEHLRVRIGIHTGLVVVGDVGGGARREQLALGEAPNIAARLQSEALPGTIVISSDTRKLLAGQFELEDLGSRTLKGLSRPMQVFRVLGKSSAASRFRARTAAHGLTPFVGRERETEVIRAAWEEAILGRGSTVLLRGEAGIGKSRLLTAAAQAASSHLHEVFEAECSPYQMNSPLSPVVEMLTRRMGIEEKMTPAHKLDLIEQFAAGRGVPLEEAASVLAELLSVPAMGRYPEIEMPPAKRRQWTIGILAELLLHAVGGLPVLLMTEDLHWADPSTLDLLGEIVARQASLPVLIVGTSRPEISSQWLEQLKCREIRVEALPSADTRSLVARVVGGKPLPLTLIEELVNRTGGIPLFVEAVTRTVIEAGILRELEDRYELTGPLPAGLIPATVQDSLMGRIDRLGADRSVAQLAATIGRECSFELLQTVLGKSTEALANAVKHLVELELVSESGAPPEATYIFKHALIQDAAYESLLRKTRQEFHGKIAEALIHRFPQMAETKPELLARHFEGAGRTQEAIASWIKAGLQAQRRSALRESAAAMQKAIALLETLPADDRGRLQSELEAQLSLSASLMAILGWGAREVEAACLRAREICERLGNKERLSAALWGLWSVYVVRGTMRESLSAATPVLEMALAARDPKLEIAARQAVGYATYFLGRFEESREHGEKGLALYTLERDRELTAAYQLPLSWSCGHFKSTSLWFLGYPELAERARRHAWSLIEALNMPAATAYGLGCSMMLHYPRRDRAEIARISALLRTISNEEGYIFWQAVSHLYGGWAQAMGGEVQAGIDEMKAGLEAFHRTGSGLMEPQWGMMMCEAQILARRPGEALAALSVGMRHVDEFHEHVNEPELHRLKGEILLGQGAAAAGEASLRRAIEIARAQKAKMLEIRAAVPLVKALAQKGRGAEALDLLAPLYGWFQEGFDTPELRAAAEALKTLRDTGLKTQDAASRLS